ncbi:MAG: endo-1,4-beta-xylanase [Chitinispirillaceae bacterium]|nr:endo-1,4-beta-xylanase [Chitinispirillaceae bacterium]
MFRYKTRSRMFFGSFLTLGCLVSSSIAQDVPSFRKRDMTITVLDGSTPKSGIEVKVEQIRHHFGFGGAMAYWPFDTTSLLSQYNKKNPEDSILSYTDYSARFGDIAAKYGPTFAKYFQWITPENEQKWTDVQYQRGADNYYKGDSLVAFAKRNNIKVRGHNLFWNEHMGWIPDWADTIAYNAWKGEDTWFDTGKVLIDQRTEECLKHFEGQCAHWDVINEIVHGQVDTVKIDAENFVALGAKYGTLKTLTNMSDVDIYERILKKADEVDKNSLFCLNDYNMITRWSRNDKVPDKYAEVFKALTSKGCRVDIIGCEGHFGEAFGDNQFTQSALKSNIDYIAGKIPNAEIWITEMDFEAADANKAATYLETFMNTFFNHERVGGIVLWTPWQGNRWREQLKSFVVDSSLNETPLGKMWREKIESWTTKEMIKTTGDDGKVALTGVHGEYKITVVKDGVTYEVNTYLAPGTGAHDVKIAYEELSVRERKAAVYGVKHTIFVNNHPVSFRLPATEKGQLFISAYSLAGRLISRVPLSFNDGVCRIEKLPGGCHVFNIGTELQSYHTAVGTNVK